MSLINLTIGFYVYFLYFYFFFVRLQLAQLVTLQAPALLLLANNTSNPTGLTQAITWVGASSSKYPKAIVKPLFLSSSPK